MNVDVKSCNYLIQILKNNPRINYIARAVTPWQALGVDSAISFLAEQGLSPQEGVSIVVPHKKTGFCCNETIFSNESQHKFCVDILNHGLNKVYKNVLLYLFLFGNFFRKKKKDFYIIGATPDSLLASIVFCLKTNRHIKFLLIDDGAAKYMNTLKAARPREGLINILKYIHFSYFGGSFIEKYHDVFHFQMLLSINGQWTSNASVVSQYKNVLNLKKNKICNITFEGPPENTFVICTTAWDRSLVADNEDLKVLLRICSFLHEKGYNLILKTHPRDSFFEKYSNELHCANIEFGQIPMETICAQNHFRGIISFSSTILYTANILFNIPTYCISDMLCRNKIDAFYLNEIDRFKENFVALTKFIKKETEITQT